MIMLDALALPVVVSSPHTSGGLAYKQGQRKKDNPESRFHRETVNPYGRGEYRDAVVREEA